MTVSSFTLKTKRLFLRQPVANDANSLFTLMADLKLTEHLSWQPHRVIETTSSLIKSLISAQENDKGYHWVILYEGQIVGLISLIDVRRNLRCWEMNRSELSYWITDNSQGKGFATEAAQSIVEYGLFKLNMHKIIVAHAEANIGSQKVIEKLGFKKYAKERDAFKKNGTWNTLVWYDILHNEYR